MQAESRITLSPKTKPDYVGHFQALDAQFMSDLQLGATQERTITYHIASSSGIPLAINQIATTRTLESGEQLKHYYFLAFDENTGHLMGHTKGEIIVPESSGLRRLSARFMPLHVNSEMHMTVSAVRGEGIGSSLELVHTAFLQDQANRLHRPIRFKAINGNIVMLGVETFFDMRKLLNSTASAGDIANLRNKGAEQTAWQHIWGNHGILGMRGNRRTFRPNGSSIISATDIWLERTPPLPNGQVNVKVVKAA